MVGPFLEQVNDLQYDKDPGDIKNGRDPDKLPKFDARKTEHADAKFVGKGRCDDERSEDGCKPKEIRRVKKMIERKGILDLMKERFEFFDDLIANKTEDEEVANDRPKPRDKRNGDRRIDGGEFVQDGKSGGDGECGYIEYAGSEYAKVAECTDMLDDVVYCLRFFDQKEQSDACEQESCIFVFPVLVPLYKMGKMHDIGSIVTDKRSSVYLDREKRGIIRVWINE